MKQSSEIGSVVEVRRLVLWAQSRDLQMVQMRWKDRVHVQLVTIRRCQSCFRLPYPLLIGGV